VRPKGPKMVKNKFIPAFYLRNMLRDLELVTNTTLSSIACCNYYSKIYRTANNNIGFSYDDYTAILAFLQRINRMENKLLK